MIKRKENEHLSSLWEKGKSENRLQATTVTGTVGKKKKGRREGENYSFPPNKKSPSLEKKKKKANWGGGINRFR